MHGRRPTRGTGDRARALLLLAPLLAGCYPFWSGNRLEDRIVALENATEQQREASDQLRRDFETRFAERLKKIDDTVDSLNKAAHRTTAEVGAQVDELLHQIQLLRGDLADLKFKNDDLVKRLDDMDRRVTALGGDKALERLEAKKGLADVERPADKKAFFTLAKGYHDRKEYSYSRPLFGEFIEKWRFDELAPEAQLLIADSYFDEKQYRAAILEYQKVRENWAKSKQVPDALYRLGLSFLELGMKDEGKAFLEQAAQFTGQDAGKKAKDRLKELSRKK
jgi:TolA-binding protein